MTCDSTSVPPPDVAVWYDLAATRDDVLAELRLTDTDVDVPRVEAIIPAVAMRFDEFFDRIDTIPGPPPPPLVQRRLVTATVVEYRNKDAPFQAALPTDIGRADLLPFKQRFGIS